MYHEIFIFLNLFAEFSLDINECNVNNAGCSHLCNNTAGTFNCYCHEGFELQNNTFSCRGKSDYKNDYTCRSVYLNYVNYK